MRRVVQSLIAGSFLTLAVGCSATGNSVTGKSASFTLTADLPQDFFYKATALYVPASGETCRVPGGKGTHVVFNRKWRKNYQQNSEVELYRTVSGCPLMLYSVNLDVYAIYGESVADFGTDFGKIAVRPTLSEHLKDTFNAMGESELYSQCQWLFRTSGSLRRIVKILDCKDADAQGQLTRGHPFAAYTLDQLPGKTVLLRIKHLSEERPAVGDTWVKVPGGWMRCMGKGFEDQRAFCYGNDKDFSTFRMPDGRDTCTIYPGCIEDKELTP